MRKTIARLLLLPFILNSLWSFADTSCISSKHKAFPSAKIQQLPGHALQSYKVCKNKTDNEYEQLLVGKWKVISGELYEQLKKEGFEIRYTYNFGGFVTFNLGDIHNQNLNVYTAEGTYYVANGRLYEEFYWESHNIGFINKKYFSIIQCMDTNELKLGHGEILKRI